MSEGSNHKRSVKHSFSLYSGPFLKPVVVVFYMDLYTLEHSKDKNNISEQKNSFLSSSILLIIQKWTLQLFRYSPTKLIVDFICVLLKQNYSQYHHCHYVDPFLHCFCCLITTKKFLLPSSLPS